MELEDLQISQNYIRISIFNDTQERKPDGTDIHCHPLSIQYNINTESLMLEKLSCFNKQMIKRVAVCIAKLLHILVQKLTG